MSDEKNETALDEVEKKVQSALWARVIKIGLPLLLVGGLSGGATYASKTPDPEIKEVPVVAVTEARYTEDQRYEQKLLETIVGLLEHQNKQFLSLQENFIKHLEGHK